MSVGTSVTVRRMTFEDWPAVQAILAEGIASGIATLETEVPNWSEWNRGHLPCCRLVACESSVVAAWAALSPVSERWVYRGVADVSIYVAAGSQGRGVGGQLLQQLVACSEQEGIWTLQAAIFPENAASIALHAACGFHTVGLRDRLGEQAGVWRDILLMERRSAEVAP
jgi:phosphinothricin acetyltransferase